MVIMSKYVRVMDGLKSNAGGFEYKLDEVNVADKWNPNSLNPEEIRLTLTCEMEVKENGIIEDYKIYPSYIFSMERMTYKKVNQITREERERLVCLLKDLHFTVRSLRPIDEAIITRGGVDVSEISPKTMESKLVKGLYFVGEVLDVDAYTGGYNLQIAFATANAAALAML